MRPIISVLVVFVTAGFVGCIEQQTTRERFLDLLKEYVKSIPQPGHAAPEGAQALRMDRLKALRKASPNDFDAATLALVRFIDPDPGKRRRAVEDLASLGEIGELVFLFRASSVDPKRPQDFDALLVKMDDPLLFRLQKDAACGKPVEAAAAERALNLLCRARAESLVIMLAHRRKWTDTPGFLALAAAGRRAMGPLTEAALGQDPVARKLAQAALARTGTTESARVLADAACRKGVDAAETSSVLELLASMPAAAAGDGLALACRKLDGDSRAAAAWLLAGACLDDHAQALEEIAAGRDARAAAAARAGLARLASAKKADDCAAIAAAASEQDPLPLLDFLRARPWLCSRFGSALTVWCGSDRPVVRARACGLLCHAPGPAPLAALTAALADPERDVRLAAAVAAAARLRLGPDSALADALAVLAGSPDSGLRAAAIEALGASRSIDRAELLLGLCSHEDPATAAAAVFALSCFRSAELLRKVPLECYWGPNTRARMHLVRGMLLAGDPGATEAIEALLNSGDPEMAAFGLGLLDSSSAQKLLQNIKVKTSSPDPAVSSAAIALLGRAGGKAALGSIEYLLSSEDPRTRIDAIEALAAAGEKPERFLQWCESTDAGLRKAAILAASAGSDAATAERMQVAAFDGDPQIRAVAASALGLAADKAGLPILRVLLHDPWPAVRSNAALGLSKAAGGACSDMIAPLAKDREPEVRAAAAAALSVAGAKIEAAAIAKALAEGDVSADPSARAAMLTLLGRHESAAEAHISTTTYAAGPFDAALAAARSMARTISEQGALEHLSAAARLGFHAFADIERDGAFAALCAGAAFREKVKELEPASSGPGFLSRFSGAARIHLANGSVVTGRIESFRNEKFAVRVESGVMSISRTQVSSLEIQEEE